MSDFIFSANGERYRHEESFRKNGYIDWKVGKRLDINEGDVAYIYRKFHNTDNRTEKGIAFKAIVTKVIEKPKGSADYCFGLSENKIMDDSEFWKDISDYRNRCAAEKFVRLKIVSEYPQHIVNCAVLIDKFGLKPTPHLIHPTNIEKFYSSELGVSLLEFIESTESIPFSIMNYN